MKHVSILVPSSEASVVNIGGTHQILLAVNDVLAGNGEAPLFTVQLAGLHRHTGQPSGLFTINPDVLINEVAETDLIIIPAIFGEHFEIMQRDREFIPWILKQQARGAEVASFCVGAYFLAATGLLRGKQCATHWMHADAFRKLFPDVQLVDDKIVTDSGGIYTSGGAYAYLNLLLHLIEKYAGRDIAIHISKTFMIDIDKESQSPFMIFRGQREHGDASILSVQSYIEGHFDEKLSVTELAALAGMERRNLERRFRKATSNTLVEYIQRVRIEAAKKQFERGRRTILDVMYDVGYSDLKAFRTVFKKISGMTPAAYRRKYNRREMELASV